MHACPHCCNSSRHSMCEGTFARDLSQLLIHPRYVTAECCLYQLVSKTILCWFAWSLTSCGSICELWPSKINSLVPFTLLVPATNNFINRLIICSPSIHPKSKKVYNTSSGPPEYHMLYRCLPLHTTYRQILTNQFIRYTCILSMLPPFCVGFSIKLIEHHATADICLKACLISKSHSPQLNYMH